nr:hypothetical protein BaRGS_021876 [Batillaria attramentaria]
MTRMSTIYLPYSFGSGDTPRYDMSRDVVESLAFDPEAKLIYGVGDDYIHIIDATNASDLQYLSHVGVANTQFKGVEVCQGHVFVTYVNEANVMQGGVLVYGGYNREDGSLPQLRTVTAGIKSEPGHLSATKDCTIVVAGQNRGQFSNGVFRDPPGNVAILRFTRGFDNEPTVTSLDFTQFDSRFVELESSGVRWVYRGSDGSNPFSNDAEPQFVTFNDDFTKAFVCLQENNAVAEIDLTSNNITGIRGLGFKQWGNLDASDKDNGINIAPWPVRGMYQPDQIQFANWKKENYIITANEGNSKGYDAVHFDEDKRGAEFGANEIASSISAELRQALSDEAKLGRLVFSTIDGKTSDGKTETFYTYGGRSFSVYRASDMYQVYDSGSEFEQKMAEIRPDLFNADIEKDNKFIEEMDKRSDNRGPEPASLAVAKFGLYLVIFVGMEKPGAIAVYSVLDRMEDAKFQLLYTEGLPRENRTLSDLYNDRKLFGVEPEYMKFYPDGLADYPALLVAGAECGTISVIKIDVTDNFNVKSG